MRTNTIRVGGVEDVPPATVETPVVLRWLDAVVLAAFVVVFAGTLVGGSEFSHLHLTIGQLPLYVTDAFLLSYAIVRIRVGRKLVGTLPLKILIPLAAFALIGFVHLAIGLLSTSDRLAQLRDFMVIGYAFFLLVGLDVARSPIRVMRLYQLAALTVLPIVATGLYNLLTHHSIELTTSLTERALPIAEGLYLIMGAFVCAIALRSRWSPAWAYTAIFVLSLGGLLLVQSRSIFVALLPVVAIYMGAYRPSRHHAIALVVGTSVVAAVIVVLALNHEMPAYIGARVESLANLSTDPNATWRLKSWFLALDMARQHPLTGLGFGQLHLLPYGDAPHNSLVTIVYETGLPGAIAFLAINVGFYIFWFRVYMEGIDPTLTGLLLIALAWQVAGLSVAMFNVSLEGPFMAMFYWLSMGFVVGVHQFGKERAVT